MSIVRKTAAVALSLLLILSSNALHAQDGAESSPTATSEKATSNKANNKKDETPPVETKPAETKPTETKVEPAPSAPPAPSVSDSAYNDYRWRFGLGLGLSLGSTLRFNEVKSGGETGEVELKYKEGLTALFEARYMRKQSWGFLGGFSIDSERELDSFTVRSGGSSTTFSAGSGASKIQTSHLYANAAYLWETFYLAFGLNYSFFKFTPASGYAVSVDDNGGVGAQLGIGFNVHENVALEVWSRATYARLKIDTVDFGQGYLSQLLLQAKYIF